MIEFSLSNNPILSVGKVLHELARRNKALYIFGLTNLFLAIALIASTYFFDHPYLGTYALFKPTKFALSTTAYAWAMAWYCYYLKSDLAPRVFNGSVILLLGFEVVYILIQAARGLPSHYNLSSPFYELMFNLMALAASLVTLYTLYIAFLFSVQSFPMLPRAYLWGIRMGLFIFVVFSFEGFLMGARLSHSVGGPDGSLGIPFLNWSKTLGDLRVAHFFGMHALQVVPIISYYVLKNPRFVIVFGLLYSFLALYILSRALMGSSAF